MVDKFGPPEKLYVEYFNIGTLEEPLISSDVRMVYPSRGFDFELEKVLPSAIERTMAVNDYECYPTTSLDAYIESRSNEHQQYGRYWTNVEDWAGFED